VAKGEHSRVASMRVCGQSAFDAALAVRTQIERLRTLDMHSPTEHSRRTSDAQFLVIALWRLRMAGEMCAELIDDSSPILRALDAYDAALPQIKNLRHVLMHYDNYVLGNDKRRNHAPGSERLYGARDVGSLAPSPDGFGWLGVEYWFEPTEAAAIEIYRVIAAELGEFAVF
jgi:hypothetical protein